LGTALLFAWQPRASPIADTPRREAIPERVRHEVWRRDRGACVECGSRARLEFDHVIPVSRGGSNTPRNLELRCEPCNRRKGARI
jgi:5-methylcytosine-specific restriction endonuclease McrA